MYPNTTRLYWFSTERLLESWSRPMWKYPLSHLDGERWASFSWKGSKMEAGEGKLGSIPASMQHSSATICHCRCWWSHVFLHFHLEGHCRKTIPKTSAVPKRSNKPWFSDICKDAIKERNRALERFKREPTESNLNAYRIARAKARRHIRHSKKTSWRNYVSKMNSQTSVKSVWNRICKIKGKDTSNTVHYLSVNDRDVTSHRDIANALADNVSHNSSSAFSTDAFASVRKKAEKQTINFSSDDAEVYNTPLSMEELRDALRRAHDTSAGPDEIHYQLLKHLPDASLLLLLNIFNKIWLSGDFPSDWRKAIVIPIPKPGKNPTNPTNYRPIALTSCICKTMERMINRRLVWYLESHKLLTNVQCGFRSKRSTVDHLVRFETFCREAFIHNQHLVSVFFDLEKAYDTTWKYEIMKDLHGFGVRGRLPIFISNCFTG